MVVELFIQCCAVLYGLNAGDEGMEMHTELVDTPGISNSMGEEFYFGMLCFY